MGSDVCDRGDSSGGAGLTVEPSWDHRGGRDSAYPQRGPGRGGHPHYHSQAATSCWPLCDWTLSRHRLRPPRASCPKLLLTGVVGALPPLHPP